MPVWCGGVVLPRVRSAVVLHVLERAVARSFFAFLHFSAVSCVLVRACWDVSRLGPHGISIWVG